MSCVISFISEQEDERYAGTGSCALAPPLAHIVVKHMREDSLTALRPVLPHIGALVRRPLLKV